MDLDIPTWTAFFVALSVPIVAAIRRCAWPDLAVTGLALIVVAACYTLGQWFDQALVWPLAPSFLSGLLTAFGGQQLLFQVVKRTEPMQTLNQLGERPDPAPAVVPIETVTPAMVRRIATQVVADALLVAAPRPSRATAGSAGATPASSPAAGHAARPGATGKLEGLE